jgi:hypothetical protein
MNREEIEPVDVISSSGACAKAKKAIYFQIFSLGITTGVASV